MQMVEQKFESFQDVKDEEYRYWQSVSASERVAAGHQMSIEGYRARAIPPMDENLGQLLSALNAKHIDYAVASQDLADVEAIRQARAAQDRKPK